MLDVGSNFAPQFGQGFKEGYLCCMKRFTFRNRAVLLEAETSVFKLQKINVLRTFQPQILKKELKTIDTGIFRYL